MDISALKNLLLQGQDSVILRFGLGNALFKSGQSSEAIPHLKAAIEFDPEYSAAWKVLGKALVDVGDKEQAIQVYEKGLLVAEKKGDRQAVKEIQVFLKRLLK
ncbi:MAG: tetratricopeptide repeat protein [Gammaproteobacteria bacterium]|nr:tetratricopeptide repeat protein [Gammaproteobacteria bacterium]